MIPIYRESHYTFQFAENRIVDRFHLADHEPGHGVTVFWWDRETNQMSGVITRSVIGLGGWVELAQPILVYAGQAFRVVPD